MRRALLTPGSRPLCSPWLARLWRRAATPAEPTPDPRAARPPAALVPRRTASRPSRTPRPSPSATLRATTGARRTYTFRVTTALGPARDRDRLGCRRRRTSTNMTFAAALPRGHDARLVGGGAQRDRRRGRVGHARPSARPWSACGARRRAATPRSVVEWSSPPAICSTTSTTIRKDVLGPPGRRAGRARSTSSAS